MTEIGNRTTIWEQAARSEGGLFVAAPEGARTAGYRVEAQPGSANKDARVWVEGGRLHVAAHGSEASVAGWLHSGWLHAGDGGNFNVMYETQDGDFGFYPETASVEKQFSGSEAQIYRVSAPLADEQGRPLKKAVAYTDVYVWGACSQITLLTYFATDCYTAFREIHVADVFSENAEIGVYRNGEWKKAQDGCVKGYSSNRVCDDLRKYDAVHPFVTHISMTGEGGSARFMHEAHAAGERFEMASGDLSVTIARKEQGLLLQRIDDRKSGTLLKDGYGESLFNLLLRDVADTGDEEYMLTSGDGWGEVTVTRRESGYELRFAEPTNAALSGVAVTLEAVLKPESSRIEWEADVRCRNERRTVVRFDPPMLHMDAQEDGRLFVAYGPGQAVPYVKGREEYCISPYPSIGICMEYMALWRETSRRGMYYGIHDPQACYKMISAQMHDDVCMLTTAIPARGIGEAGNGFRMDGELVWQLFDGDWYDATLLFKDFVFRRASWFRACPATERKDVPEWMLKAPLWFQSSMNASKEWMEQLFEAQEDIGVPTATHVYNWHEIPFDTNYPHYNPAKKEFIDKAPVIQARGIKVMPYINGRLWDTHDRGDYDFEFTSKARPFVTKGRKGDPITEHYASTNSKGEPVELGVMCPSTARWQEKQMEINDWLINDVGVDAVYVDQIAAAPPVNCVDRTHPHRPGGGSWWYEHYYNLIDHLMLHTPSNKGYTTESNAEPFVGHISAMLVWHWSGDYQVPAFPVVYAGYQPMLGRNYNQHRDSEVFFRVMTAQSLCFGDQLGWCNPDQYLTSAYREYFKQIARIKEQYGEYFYAGRCLRPPRLEGDLGGFIEPVHSPGVLSALWEKMSGEGRLMLLTNMTDEAREVTAWPEGGEPVSVTLEAASSMAIEL